MRGITAVERETLRAIDASGECTFDREILDTQEALGRVEAWDIEPDGCYRMRLTGLGRLALRLPDP